MTFEMLMEEKFEAGMEKGIKKGREEGITKGLEQGTYNTKLSCKRHCTPVKICVPPQFLTQKKLRACKNITGVCIKSRKFYQVDLRKTSPIGVMVSFLINSALFTL